MVIIAADRVTAHRAQTGEQVWEAPLRGARIAPSAAGIVAADEYAVTLLDATTGTIRWREPLPDAADGGVPGAVVVDGDAALVVFRQHPGHPGPLDADVIAFAAA